MGKSMRLYINAEKFPTAFFRHAFQAVRVYAAAAAHRGYIFLLQFTKWKRAEYSQASSQSANQPGTQSKCTVKIPAAKHIYIYIYFCALYCTCIYIRARGCVYICEHTEANSARSPATAAADAKLAK